MSDDAHKSQGLRSLADLVGRVAGPVLGRRGFAEAEILRNWHNIAGAEFAGGSLPGKLSFPKREERVGGTLQLRVVPGMAVEFQHLEPILIQRINGFLGYGAVSRLSLRQGPLPGSAPKAPPPPRPLTQAEETSLGARLDGIADPGLRQALEGLGRAVLGTPPKR